MKRRNFLKKTLATLAGMTVATPMVAEVLTATEVKQADPISELTLAFMDGESLQNYDAMTHAYADGYDTTWIDPMTGEKWDMSVRYDEETKQVMTSFKKKFEIFMMPTEEYIQAVNPI